MVNRINITINSRVYTLVASENTEYLKKLGEYVNEKVDTVIREGSNVIGERPLVLAALNICDEYFKLMDKSQATEKMQDVLMENKKLAKELRELKTEYEKNNGETADLHKDLDITKKMLDESEEKVKFLEGQITLKEGQIKKQRTEFALREKEMLDMLDQKS